MPSGSNCNVISKVKATDEDEYKLTIENCHGTDEAYFRLYVSGESRILISCRVRIVFAEMLGVI